MGDQRFLLDPTAAAPEGWALANGDFRIWYQSGHAQDRKLLPSLTLNGHHGPAGAGKLSLLNPLRLVVFE